MDKNEEQVDYCVLCDGVQGPDHVHYCANCGVETDPTRQLAFGYDGGVKRVYCCLYCHLIAEPDGDYAQGIPADKKDKIIRREELLHAQRELRRQCLEEGVPWIH